MKKTKVEKGITLIALIITIIILLILAVVTIGSIKDSNIITYAQNASSEYNKGKEKEEGILSQYEAMLDEQQGIGPWKLQEDGETIKNGKTGVETKIGGEFSNEDVLKATGGTKGSYEGTWTVLGTENGKLKLVSTTNVATNIKLGKEDSEVYVKDENGNPTETLKPEIIEVFNRGSETSNLDLEKAIWSYQHAVETLNKHAKTSTGIESARSIKIEDIEAREVLNITNDKKLDVTFDKYGKICNYYFDEEDLKLASIEKRLGTDTWSGVTVSPYSSAIFVDKDGKTIVVDSKDDQVTLDYTKYSYSGIFWNTKFENSLGNGYYWLASNAVDCIPTAAYFYVFCITDKDISSNEIFESNGYATGNFSGVRAIVYI